MLGKISLDELAMLQEYSALNVKAHTMSIKIYQQKKELVEKLNEVLEKQLTSYTKEREDIAKDYTELIDDLDNDPERATLLKKINTIHEKICDLMHRADAIRKTIPDNAIFTNYSLTLDDNTSSVSGLCSVQADKF